MGLAYIDGATRSHDAEFGQVEIFLRDSKDSPTIVLWDNAGFTVEEAKELIADIQKAIDFVESKRSN
jgi:hypothetical protein